MYPSLAINNKAVRFACITNSEEYGHGVYSWHATLHQANHNARMTGGIAVEVNRDTDGCVIIPETALRIINDWLSQ